MGSKFLGVIFLTSMISLVMTITVYLLDLLDVISENIVNKTFKILRKSAILHLLILVGLFVVLVIGVGIELIRG